MKNLIYFFLFFSTVVFSQNYNYAVEEAPKKTIPTLPVVNNQLEEIAYFKAYLLPITKKATLQSALDTYGSVRLEKGDYSGVDIVMKSNQRLYGHPSFSKVSKITIASGSSGVVLENLLETPITLQSGSLISNCTINTIKYSDITATNATLENNTFLNVIGKISFNCSTSGYFRNNKIIKHQVQSVANQLVMKGNSTTPSYGNVNIHSNYLSSIGFTTDLDNLETSTFIGIDCETYDGITRELFYAKNIGKLNLAVTQGGIYFPSGFGFYNIDATSANFLGASGSGDSNSLLSPRTNAFDLNSRTIPIRSSGTVSGFTLRSNFDTYAMTFNGTEQTTTMSNATDIANISNSIVGTKYTPWDRPKGSTLPDPLGSTWSTDRTGKKDSTSYIQGLIDTNGIAELPEGIYYISSTLNLLNDYNHGIVGSGTGKTVICGLTNDFPLIKVKQAASFGNFILANLTLQGGNVGLLLDGQTTFIAYQNLKFLIFRNQTYGIQVHQINALDNNFFDNISFIDCTKGFFQDPIRPYIQGNLEGSSYVDKTLFYNSQFINCTTAVDMDATRPNNMNAWVNCKFNGGSQVFNGGGNSSIFANCDFSNYTGSNIMTTNKLSLFSCNFYNNSNSIATLNSMENYIEGCNFLDNNYLLTPNVNMSVYCNIINSTITGNVLTTGNHPLNASFTNSTLLANPTLSKLLVNVKAGVPKVIINATPNPYPQYLVTQ